jgi:hypothetical protein
MYGLEHIYVSRVHLDDEQLSSSNLRRPFAVENPHLSAQKPRFSPLSPLPPVKIPVSKNTHFQPFFEKISVIMATPPGVST